MIGGLIILLAGIIVLSVQHSTTMIAPIIAFIITGTMLFGIGLVRALRAIL